MSERLAVGDEVEAAVRGRVVAVHDAHGLSYEVEAEQRDYQERRIFHLDPDELLSLDTERARTVVLRKLVDHADRLLASMTYVPGSAQGGLIALVTADISEARAALAVLPVDRVGVEPLDVPGTIPVDAIDAIKTLPYVMVDRMTSRLVELDQVVGLLKAWITPDPRLVAARLSDEEATAMANTFAARLIESPTEGETP